MKLFIAEDSAMICARLVTILSDVQGISISGFAHNFGQAISMIKETNPDVVLIGSHNPRVNAIKLLRFIKNESPGIIVMMLTDYPVLNFEDTTGNGANFRFDKVADLEKLVETLGAISQQPGIR